MSMSPTTRMFVYAVVVADLFAIVGFGGRYILTGSVMAHADEQPIVVAAAQQADPAAAGAAPAEAAPAFNYATYTPNVANGTSISGKCKACHTFGNGEPNRTGPNLWGIAGAKVAGHAGFAYSDAMKAHGGVWSDDRLMAYLENPRANVSGTKMQFAGIKKPEDRADLIAYLKTLK
ncbi:MAG: cytochrome c family protein [Alphaproteobacteria bacterium]